MSNIIICDICKKNVEPVGKIPSYVNMEFKYREHKEDWLEKYRRMDMCDMCFDKMLDFIQSRGEVNK
jgi:hypothetical protein